MLWVTISNRVSFRNHAVKKMLVLTSKGLKYLRKF